MGMATSLIDLLVGTYSDGIATSTFDRKGNGGWMDSCLLLAVVVVVAVAVVVVEVRGNLARHRHPRQRTRLHWCG